MDRRGFLGTLIGGVAAGAAVRTWPFRVFSFPTEVITENELIVPISTVVNHVRGEFALLLAPGLRHIFLNFDALKSIVEPDQFEVTYDCYDTALSKMGN